ncbi:hypothetical protein ACIF8T_18855 [Streptomyces sp. NPDC085946]|uniref:hypothetical protein n=1 Tax=Streptomyces sp. NPDC085946 TaxID=3365744 RepID=UPI0037D22CC3
MFVLRGAHQPDLLVTDEPAVGPDPMVRRESWLVFQRPAREGATLLVPGHVMDEADRCDRLLLKPMFHDSEPTFERVGPQVFGIFPVVVMYMVASVSTPRERATGTAERLLTMPVQRLDIVLGYSLAVLIAGATTPKR